MDLVTLQEAKEYLGVETSDDDTLIAQLISGASGLAERYVGNALGVVTYENERATPIGSNNEKLYLAHYPVVSIAEVKDDDDNVIPPTNYVVREDIGLLLHKRSWPRSSTTGTLRITYDAGHWANVEDVNPEIKLAVNMLIAARYASRTSQRSQSLGDFSSTSWETIPPEVRIILDRFKKVEV